MVLLGLHGNSTEGFFFEVPMLFRVYIGMKFCRTMTLMTQLHFLWKILLKQQSHVFLDIEALWGTVSLQKTQCI